MKNNIAFKLAVYFTIGLLLFTLVIGGVFTTLFKRYTIDFHKAELENRANQMADNLSEFLRPSSGDMGMGGMGMSGNRMKGYGAYIGFIEDIAGADVWIVDEGLDLITTGHMGHHNFKYNDLPQDAEKVVQEVFLGKTTFSQGFSDLLNTPTLTIGAPIKQGEKVIGALLLHSPVEGINRAISSGLEILAISLFIALVIGIIFSIMVALGFTKPLRKINTTALRLADGDYSIKTNIRQKDEIGELASTIDILSERLYRADKERENLNKLRQDFLANISHELRTPVTIIRGSLEALNDQVVTQADQVEDYYRQMLEESIYLQRLVNDLLELSRLRNLDFNIVKEDLNFSDVIKDTLRSVEYMARKKNITINSRLDKKVFMIEGDYGRLRQMLLIILDNAIKFSSTGEKVEVDLKNGLLTIRDRGIGISKADLPYIFDRFTRIKTEKNKKGTGLGLAIAKEIAQRHNMKITIDSEENKGTTVRLVVSD